MEQYFLQTDWVDPAKESVIRAWLVRFVRERPRGLVTERVALAKNGPYLAYLGSTELRATELVFHQMDWAAREVILCPYPPVQIWEPTAAHWPAPNWKADRRALLWQRMKARSRLSKKLRTA